MSILTPFFNLIKPTKQDGVKVSDFNANMDVIDTEMHRPPLTVNGTLPNETTRDIHIESVPLADNLTSDDAQFNVGTYLERTSGGSASIADGDASISTIKGNMVKTGYVPEVLDMTVNAVPRVAPAAITATLDDATFEAYVETAGTYTLSYTTEWSADPADYGVTVSNTPVSGDSIVIEWDGENAPVMSVNAVERPVPAAITATLDRATFVAYVQASGTVTLSYTTAWSANPALYGVTVSNTPVSGDSIVIEYVKEDRGTITPVKITAFNSTGWNLYDNSVGYAKVVKYSDDYGYCIDGSYSLVRFATTPTGTPAAVDVQGGYFNVPSDGYVLVTGGDVTTCVYATWSDWTDGYDGEFQSYTDDVVDLSEIMVNFAGGLLAIGDVRDEINFNLQKAISRIERLAYTAENLAAVIASGRLYDTDTDYIYVVRASNVEYNFSEDGTYIVSDHGIEFYTATTTTAPVTETLYGENLKDKLRTDVVTISGGLVNNLTSTATNKALAAAQGKALDDKISTINSKIAPNTFTNNVDANNYTTYGNYHVGISTNQPEGTSVQYGMLNVYTGGSGFISQIFVESNNRMYFRYKNNSSSNWLAWQRVALKSELNNYRTTGYVGVFETISTSGTNVNYTIPSDGLYAIRASTAATAGTLSVYMFENSGANITNIQNVDVGAWASIFTPPMPMIAGTQIKAQFIGPTGATGAIVKYGN